MQDKNNRHSPQNRLRSLRRLNGKWLRGLILLVPVVLILALTIFLQNDLRKLGTGSLKFPEVYLNPPAASFLISNHNQSYDIYIDPHSHPVTAAEIELEYDPRFLQITEISHAEGLPIVLQTILTDSRAFISLGAQPQHPLTQAERVAKIKFETYQTPGSTQIRFTENTSVSALGLEGNALGVTDPATLALIDPLATMSGDPSPESEEARADHVETQIAEQELADISCTYIVSPDGDDANPGTRATAPLRTIQQGVNKLSPGDMLCVRNGTYHEQVTIRNSGSNSRPITVIAYPGESPIIDGRAGVDCLNCGLPTGDLARTDPVSGKGFTYNTLVGIEGDYVHLEGFTITRSMGRCLRIWTKDRHVTGTVVRDNVIHDCRNSAIMFVNAPDNSLIENNDVSGAGSYATYSRSASSLDWTSAVSVVDGTNTIVRGNVIHENWGEGAIIGRRQAHTIFEDNVLYDNYALQLYVHATDDALVQRNLLYHTGNPDFFRGGKPSSCIVLTSAEPQFTAIDLSRIRIINNITAGCSNNIAFWSGSGQIRDVLVAHNTLVNAVDPIDPPVAIRVGHSDKGNMSDVVIANNIVLQESGILIEEFGQTGVSYTNNLWSSGRPPSNASSPDDVIGDPGLVYPDGPLAPGAVRPDWYRLGQNSPAVAAASALPQVEEDFFRSSRDQTPDIGTHELSISDGETEIFLDVPSSHPFHAEIETLYLNGYVAGCSQDPLLFCPDQAMTRAESAVFVERGLWGAGYQPSDPAEQFFDDITLDSWAAKWATGLYQDGYTAGCNADPLRYCPWFEHTRTEGAVFFLRMLYGGEYVPPEPRGIFSDVDLNSWGAKWIEAAYDAGLVLVCEENPLRFCPEDPLTRGMAAWMMIQAKEMNN